MKKLSVEAYTKKIIEETGLTKNEIQKLIDEKKDELKGLISDEGALFIIAKELGLDIKPIVKEETSIYLVEVTKKMKNLILVGKIVTFREIHEFVKKDGTEGKVLNFIISDKTGQLRIVAWGEMATKIFINEDFKEGNLIKITNGYSRFSDYHNEYEVHLSRYSKVEFNPKVSNPEEYDDEIDGGYEE